MSSTERKWFSTLGFLGALVRRRRRGVLLVKVSDWTRSEGRLERSDSKSIISFAYLTTSFSLFRSSQMHPVLSKAV